MALGDVLKPAGDMFGGTLARLAGYAWVLWIAVVIGLIVAVVFIIKQIKHKKAQWTHTLVVRRVLPNNLLSKPYIHKMRRFPLIKKAEVFELEKPLLGGYLLPEPDMYCDVNEYSIILDNNNRIYRNTGEYFCPDTKSVNVSAKHAEIDIQRANLKADFQEINKINKRTNWKEIMRSILTAILIISVMIVLIVGIGEWGDAQQAKAQSDQAFASAMESLSEAMRTVEDTVKTQELLIPRLQELYQTKNLQNVVK